MLVCGPRVAVAPQTPEEVGSCGVERVVVIQVQLVDCLQCCRWAQDLADGDRAIEGYNRGGGEDEQLVV